MKKLSKLISFAAAAVMTAASMPAVMPVADAADTSFPYVVEGENLEGATLWTSIYETQLPGYSGEGFTYLSGGDLTFTVTVPEDGMYSIVVKGAQILNEEGRFQTITVNGSEYSKTVPYTKEWTDFDFGMVRLNKGENTISFINKYGYMAIDYVTVSEAEFPDLSIAATTLIDPKASPEAKSLMKYLGSVYGKNILSGQQEIYGGGHSVETTIRYDATADKCVDSDGVEYEIDRDSLDTDKDGNKFYWHCTGADGQVYTYNTQNRNYGYNDYGYEVRYLKETTGVAPAIRGFDFGSYCPCYAWDDGVAQRMIDWGKDGGICTASWHINVPTNKADYTMGEPLDFAKTTYSEKTDFVTANCMVEGTYEYEYFQLCIDNLAAELKKVEAAGVPIIFRPLHEAEGNGPEDGKGAWFWWAKEGAEVYKQLWAFLQDELMNKRDIHNLIWEQNLYTWGNTSVNWYSGDDKVDIVGYDKYNTQYHRHDGNASGVPNEDAEAGIFYQLYDMIDGKKMIAMAENDSIPSLTNMLVEHAYWLYFCPWYDSEQAHFVTGKEYQNVDTLTELYQSEFNISLDELPADLYGNGSSASTTSTATTTKTPASTTTTVVSSDIVYGDADGSNDISVSDIVIVLQYSANKEKYPLDDDALTACDVNLDKTVDSKDAALIQQADAGLITLPYTK